MFRSRAWLLGLIVILTRVSAAVSITINSSPTGQAFTVVCDGCSTGSLTQIQGLPGFSYSTLFAINRNGTILGGSCDGTCVGFLWTPILPNATTRTTAVIPFPATFGGNRVFYVASRDLTDANNSGWQAAGTWTVQ